FGADPLAGYQPTVGGSGYYEGQSGDYRLDLSLVNLKGSLLVTTLNDGGLGSLRAAIGYAASGHAPSGNHITFDPSLAGKTILIHSELDISTNLAIQGLGAGRLTISRDSSFGYFRVFKIAAGATDAISDLTI